MVHQFEILMLFVRNDVDMDSVDVLIEQVVGQDLPQPGGHLLVGLQLGLHLLRGEDGPPVAQGGDVTGGQQFGVPTRQYLQSVLLHQNFTGEQIKCQSSTINITFSSLTREEFSGHHIFLFLVSFPEYFCIYFWWKPLPFYLHF